MVLQPGGGNMSAFMMVPVAGGFLYALGNLATQHWCARESTVLLVGVIIVMQGMIGAVALIALSFGVAEGAAPSFVTRGWAWPLSPAVWGMIGAQVVCSFIGVFCIVRAYQWGEASYVSVFEYSVMVFGPGFGLILFQTPIAGAQVIGIGLIIAAGAIIALRSRG